MSAWQGDIWWAQLEPPRGSEPGYRRPVVIVQGNTFNRSALNTVVVVPVTANLKRALGPGNVELTPRQSGLSKKSVAVVSGIRAMDRSWLTDRVGHLPKAKLELVLAGIDVMLGRQ